MEPIRKLCSLLCPTRERPDRLKMMARSAFRTATDRGSIELLVYVDQDDPRLADYRQLAGDLKQELGDVRLEVGEPMGVPRAFNLLSSVSQGEALVTSSDDVRFVTQGWDVRLREEMARFPDQIYCIWFDDGALGERQCSFPVISRVWYETVGYFHSMLFEHFYSDTWTHALATTIGRAHYVKDVLVEHLHWSVGKAKQDDTYLRNTSLFPGRRKRDQAHFENFQKYLHVDAALLLGKIKEYQGELCTVRIGLVPRTPTGSSETAHLRP